MALSEMTLARECGSDGARRRLGDGVMVRRCDFRKQIDYSELINSEINFLSRFLFTLT